MLDQVFILALPIVLMIIALASDSIIFASFGGISAIFVGFTLLDTLWAAMIFLGLGIYFMLIAVFVEWEGA